MVEIAYSLAACTGCSLLSSIMAISRVRNTSCQACNSPSIVAVETFAHRIVCAVQRECGVTETLRVAPLFETLDDLHNSEASMEGLLSNKWYHAHIGGRQECMIGYSDSGKDAGRLAAAWGLYDVQVVPLTRPPCIASVLPPWRKPQPFLLLQTILNMQDRALLHVSNISIGTVMLVT